MKDKSTDWVENRKKAIFDSMSPKRQNHIKKKGYYNWDPFEEPKDPIDIRKDKTNRTTQMLVSEFLQNCPEESYGNSYSRGALETALGIVNNESYFKGVFDFVCWYIALLKEEGRDIKI